RGAEMKTERTLLKKRPRLSGEVRRGIGLEPGVGRLARQRRPAWVVAGVMLMVLAVLVNVYLFNNAGERVSVVVLARDVPVGQQISRADLATGQVALDATVQTVPGHQLDEVVGQRAAVGLVKGSLLVASQVTRQVSPGPGQALVTVPLKITEVPPGLAPGWQVRVISAPNSASTSLARDNAFGSTGEAPQEAAAPPDVAAVVDRVSEPNTDGSVTVSLLVADSESVGVARQAGAGAVALVVTARRGS
uniref:SAF domain-containing protein n=1 Tax=Actinomadura sp. SCN-SB TaxID=3373092 RepID=UPI0037507798